MVDNPHENGRAETGDTAALRNNPSVADSKPTKELSYPAWLIGIAGFLIVGLLTWVGWLAREYMHEKFSNVDKNLDRVGTKIGAVDGHLQELEKTFKSFQLNSEGEQERLHKSIEAIKRRMPKEVQDQIDLLMSKYSLAIQRQQDELKKKIEETKASTDAALKEVQDARANGEAAGKRIVELETQSKELEATLWEIRGPALKAQVEQTVKKKLERIVAEWEEVAKQQSGGMPAGTGSSFIPPGTVVTTRPEVQISVEPGVVRLGGVVPSEPAKDTIVEAVEKAAQEFRPKLKVESADLKVKP